MLKFEIAQKTIGISCVTDLNLIADYFKKVVMFYQRC